ncbi:sigma-70 family RNA polymerase sigma factor [Pseudovibrio sp. SPO723]|uniref:sigma-70 family RNA polymerase sigma factor n=1 Tax=Nesiotobacter zosterae TaxID=392721 RepID=UPI0029C4B124|nr:sigma-70 family RNA polymerase sigma factor [Pseudovibrio sp. SPO723]MDX5593234.1 sigma-70 family RNA polymerase sigma factor [Pseudovibrio sp. SPO723]
MPYQQREIVASPSGGTSVPPNRLSQLLATMSATQDRGSFRELYDYFAPRLKQFYMRSGTDEAMAEEMVQETFVLVWRKSHLYDPSRSAASTWIFTIARNHRIDRLRREKRFVQKEEHFFEAELVDDGTQDRDVDQPKMSLIINEALAELPPNQAELVRLSFYEEVTHAEIASRLQLPLGTVKSRLRLAFGRLRKKLAEFET